MTLNLKVEEQVLRMESNTRIAQGSVGSVVLAFTFDSAWDAYTTKYAIFQYGEAPYFKVEITDGTATVPHFVVAKPYFKVSVKGTDGTNSIASTVEKIYVDFAPQMVTAETSGIYTASSSDGSITRTKNGENLDLKVSSDYTKNLQEQITANANAITEEAATRLAADATEEEERTEADTAIRTDLTGGNLVPLKASQAVKDQNGNTIDSFYATVQALANHVAEYAELNGKVIDLQGKVVTPSKFQINYEASTGYIELYYDGTLISRFDSPLETAFKSVSYNAETKKLTLISASNSVTIDIGDLVDTYKGSNGTDIKVTVENHEIKASLNDGSVTRDKLASEIYNTLLTYDEIIAKYTEIALAEDTRVSNETTRQSNESIRQSQEESRQSAEALRVEAENNRVEAETERESAESSRQSTFETNEASRQSTFNSNEETRQSNENTRISNEETRVKAEAGRVTAENERVEAEKARQEIIEEHTTRLDDHDARIHTLERDVGRIEEDDVEWDDIIDDIKAGYAKDYYEAGDQIKATYTYSGTEYVCENNIVDFTDAETEDGTTYPAMTLEWEYTVPYGLVFDPSEALMTVSANGLPAGTYNFKVQNDDWYTGDNGKYIQFTLTAALTEGMQIRPTQTYNATHVGANICVYADGKSTTALYTMTMSEGQDGTFLGTMGGTDASATAKSCLKSQFDDGIHYLNHCHCVIFGNNRWKYSYARQQLNSEGTGWWVQQHCWDRAPGGVDSVVGFLSGLDDKLREKLKPVKIVTPVNYKFYSVATDTTYDKVYLHSKKNMCWSPDGDESMNVQWEYYRNLADSVLGEGKNFADWATYPALIRYALNAKTSAQYVWNRCPIRYYAYGVWFVTPSGRCHHNGASDTLRVLPAYTLIGK